MFDDIIMTDAAYPHNTYINRIGTVLILTQEDALNHQQ